MSVGQMFVWGGGGECRACGFASSGWYLWRPGRVALDLCPRCAAPLPLCRRCLAVYGDSHNQWLKATPMPPYIAAAMRAAVETRTHRAVHAHLVKGRQWAAWVALVGAWWRQEKLRRRRRLESHGRQ